MAKDRNKPKTTTQNTPRTGSRAVERRKERERERRRQRLITGGIIVVALVAVAAFIFFIVNTPATAPIPDGALTRYDGLPQSRTPEGYPRIGDPGSAVQVAEYSSFDCPHCRDFHDQGIDQVVDRVRAGNIALTFVPLYGTGDVANGQGAAAAAICAAEQGKFWPFHDALFDWQGQFGNQAFTNNRITAGVKAFGLDEGVFNSCIASSRPGDVLNTARTQAAALLNYSGTPTITINGVVPLGQDQQPINDPAGILARIDSEVARVKVQPRPVPQATAEATLQATESLAAPTAEVTPETTQAG